MKKIYKGSAGFTGSSSGSGRGAPGPDGIPPLPAGASAWSINQNKQLVQAEGQPCHWD